MNVDERDLCLHELCERAGPRVTAARRCRGGCARNKTRGRVEMTVDERDLCLHELFERQVQKTPDATAVVDAKTTLTYADLDRRGAAPPAPPPRRGGGAA